MKTDKIPLRVRIAPTMTRRGKRARTVGQRKHHRVARRNPSIATLLQTKRIKFLTFPMTATAAVKRAIV